MPFITNEQIRLAIKAINAPYWGDDCSDEAEKMLNTLLDQSEGDKKANPPAENTKAKMPILVFNDGISPVLGNETDFLYDGLAAIHLKSKPLVDPYLAENPITSLELRQICFESDGLVPLFLFEDGKEAAEFIKYWRLKHR